MLLVPYLLQIDKIVCLRILVFVLKDDFGSIDLPNLLVPLGELDLFHPLFVFLKEPLRDLLLFLILISFEILFNQFIDTFKIYLVTIWCSRPFDLNQMLALIAIIDARGIDFCDTYIPLQHLGVKLIINSTSVTFHIKRVLRVFSLSITYYILARRVLLL